MSSLRVSSSIGMISCIHHYSFSPVSDTVLRQSISTTCTCFIKKKNKTWIRLTQSYRGQSACLQCGRPRFDPWVRKIPWRRKWQSTPVLLPGESHGQRSLVGYSPWGHRESDTTEWLHFHFSVSRIGGKRQPTPVFLPGKSHGQRSLVGYSPWGHRESDTTERLHFHFHFFTCQNGYHQKIYK